MDIFISGPVTTGPAKDLTDEQVLGNFAAAEAVCMRRWPGRAVWNPVRWVSRGADRPAAMAQTLTALASMSRAYRRRLERWEAGEKVPEPMRPAIVCLPGWEHSRGATLEVEAAEQLGFDHVEYGSLVQEIVAR